MMVHGDEERRTQQLAWKRSCSAALLLLLGGTLACAPPRGSQVTIGAKNFTEQVVLGELLAQEIEASYAAEGRTAEKVNRRFYLAGSYLCHQALINGRIDGYVEYTGTALTAILKQPLPRVKDVKERIAVFSTVRDLYHAKYAVHVEPGLGFEDTFAIVIRGEDARRLHLQQISDLRLNAPAMRLGVGYEFQSRPDGLAGLEKEYELQFPPPRVMDLGLLYRSLHAGEVDVVAGNSTDGPIRIMGFTVLKDDRRYFPPYEAVPLFREDSLQAHPEIQRAMDRLAGQVSAPEVQAMNDAVDGRHEDVADVVGRFRKEKGL